MARRVGSVQGQDAKGVETLGRVKEISGHDGITAERGWGTPQNWEISVGCSSRLEGTLEHLQVVIKSRECWESLPEF